MRKSITINYVHEIRHCWGSLAGDRWKWGSGEVGGLGDRGIMSGNKWDGNAISKQRENELVSRE